MVNAWVNLEGSLTTRKAQVDGSWNERRWVTKTKKIRACQDLTRCYHLNRWEQTSSVGGLPSPVTPNGGRANRFLSTF